jgi:hypothetical protein
MKRIPKSKNLLKDVGKEQRIFNRLHQYLGIGENDYRYKDSILITSVVLIEYITTGLNKKNQRSKFRNRFLQKMDMLLWIALQYDHQFWIYFAVKHGGRDVNYPNRFQIIEGQLLDVHEDCPSHEHKLAAENAIIGCRTVRDAREKISLALLSNRLDSFYLQFVYEDDDQEDYEEDLEIINLDSGMDKTEREEMLSLVLVDNRL